MSKIKIVDGKQVVIDGTPWYEDVVNVATVMSATIVGAVVCCLDKVVILIG